MASMEGIDGSLLNSSINSSFFNQSNTTMINGTLIRLPANFNPATDQLIRNPDGGIIFIHQFTVTEFMWHYWYLFALFFIIIAYLSNKYLAPLIMKKYVKNQKGENDEASD